MFSPETKSQGRLRRLRAGRPVQDGTTPRELAERVLTDRDGETLATQIRFLRDIGFLELVGSSCKVPTLYRDGLGIPQGRAFTTPVSGTDDEE